MERIIIVNFYSGDYLQQCVDSLLKQTCEEYEAVIVEIAPHRRHRVTCTDADGPTIWLALYFDVNGEG